MYYFQHPIHNTFHIEAQASEYIDYSSVEELQSILPFLKGKRVLHIGGGSNLLFLNDFEGVVLHSCIKGVEVVAKNNHHTIDVRVGSGVVWDDFVKTSVENGWYGVENLSLIPGEVGASAVQNIGAYGVEAKDVITEVEAVDLSDGKIHIFSNDECQYRYRSSIFKNDWKGRFAVTHVTYRLSLKFSPVLEYGNLRSIFPDERQITPEKIRQCIIDIRKQKLPDPDVTGNAGSFFMNPVIPESQFNDLKSKYPQIPSYKTVNGVKIPAGWLIEQCDWKGRRLGNAAVHDKQALVLVNIGGATGHEVLHLANVICEDVQKKFGISINPEVNVIS